MNKEQKIGISTLAIILSVFLTGCNNSKNSEKETFKEIREIVISTMKADKSPGMAIALIHNNQKVFAEGFGFTNIETKQVVTADTSFWLGSVSKTAIAVSLMHAQEEGLLGLEDNVNDILKQDSGINLSTPFTEPILLKHLTSHTSSIIDNDRYYQCAYFIGDEEGQHSNLANQFNNEQVCEETVPVSLKGFLNAYLSDNGSYYSVKNNFSPTKPNTRYEYSNIGAALSGLTFEIATSLSLADYAQTYIFEPLNMDNTSWRLSNLDANNIATPYYWDDDNERSIALPIYSLSTWPDAGLRSSANDLATYLLMMLNGGKINNSRILSKESVKSMLPQDPVNINTENTGVLWTKLKLPNGRVVIGHNGSDPGAYSYIYYDPIQKTGIVLLSNGDDEIDEEAFGKRHYGLLIDKLLNYAKSL